MVICGFVVKCVDLDDGWGVLICVMDEGVCVFCLFVIVYGCLIVDCMLCLDDDELCIFCDFVEKFCVC